MRIEVAPEVFDAYPDYRRDVLVANCVDNSPGNKGFDVEGA